MKLTHWQWKLGTNQGDRVCSTRGLRPESIKWCPYCKWDADKDVAIKFVVEADVVGGIKIKPFDNTLKCAGGSLDIRDLPDYNGCEPTKYDMM